MVASSDAIQAAVEYIDRRLATIDRIPGTWGSPENLELQTLLLFEFRTFLLRRRTHAKNPYEARFAYFRFVRSHISDATAQLMAAQISADRVEEELPKLLGAFRDEVALRIIPENPFETNELVLELVLAESGQRATTPFQYLIHFQETLTAIHHAESLPEDTSILPIPEFRLVNEESGTIARFLFNDVKHLENGLTALVKPQKQAAREAITRLRELQSQLSIKLVRIGGTSYGTKPITLEPKVLPKSRMFKTRSLRDQMQSIQPSMAKERLHSARAARSLPIEFPFQSSIEGAPLA